MKDYMTEILVAGTILSLALMGAALVAIDMIVSSGALCQ